MIIFIHIPKSSGSSFKESFKDNFTAFWNKKQLSTHVKKDLTSMINLGEKIKDIPDVLADHFPHGIHKIFNTKKYYYVTFLRNPIDRFISNFYYLLSNNKDDSELIRIFLKNNMNLSKTLEECIKKHVNNNQMTKQLSGIEPLNNIILPSKYISSCIYYRGTHANIKPYSENDMKKMFDEAKKNLNTYDFVGFQENSYSDYIRFCKEFNLRYKHISGPIKHTHRSIFKINWNNKEIIELVKRNNEYDIQLYEYAKTNHFPILN